MRQRKSKTPKPKRTLRAASNAERRVARALNARSPVLDLSNLGLTSLPKSIVQLTGLRELYLHGNPGLGLSPEILGATQSDVRGGNGEPANPAAVIDFYLGQRKRGAEPLNEVKLLIVGRGRVGKTSLSKALRQIRHNPRERETRGIERHTVTLKTKCSITGYLWDFGGQEFLHQTHQFFFSERSIYLVVLDGRQAAPIQEAEYWLRLIRSYGKDSHVVIILNRIKKHFFTIDEHFLMESYPEIAGVVRTDCNPRYGIPNLRRLLSKLAYNMPTVRMKIDPAWNSVKAHFGRMKEGFLSFNRYQDVCRKFGVTVQIEQENLATILNYLGVALNYRSDPRLHTTRVLNPRWLVDGIYRVLRQIKKWNRNGELIVDDFSKVLKDGQTYPKETHAFLLAMMEKFELCFPNEGKNRGYLVPGLLSENQPRQLKDFMGSAARRIQFRYRDIRPPGLLPRFIVRSHTLSYGQPRWLRGVVLARGNARALVRADHDGLVTDVFALGANDTHRLWLTEFILSEMRVLNDKLSVSTHVEDENQPGAWAELEILREAVRRAETTRVERAAGGSTVMVDVLQQLREVESIEVIEPRNYPPLSLFICYASANEAKLKWFLPSLTVLSNRGYIAPWRDTDLVPGEDWDEKIKQRLSNAQIVMFIVSREFLASKYITKQERPLAMDLMRRKKAVILPVLLARCSWESEDFAKLEMLPRKDRPISTIRSQNDGWYMVEEGLKRVVNEIRNGLGQPSRLIRT